MRTALLIIILFFSSMTLAESVVISDGFIKESPPGTSTSAAYFTLRNTSEQTIILISANSNIADHTELHNHTMKNGLITMKKVDQISIDPGSKLAFEPGSYHIMLMGLRSPLRPGSTEVIELVFQGGKTMAIDLPVQSITGH